MMRALLAALRNLLRRDAIERDLDAELSAALDTLVDEKCREGVPRREARRQALLELGGVEQVKDRVRDARAGALADGLIRDVRFAARLLARSPGFAVAAVATLALGIGATTTVYGWARRALLEPLPAVPRQHELVALAHQRADGDVDIGMTRRDFDEYRRRQRSFVGLYGSRLTAVNLSQGGEAERVWGGVVAGDFFGVLGVQAARGRLFGPDDAESLAPAVVISDAFWRSRFGADPTMVGRAITLNKVAHVVIGITPPGFSGGEPGIVQSLWLPHTPAEPIADGLDIDESYGRLKPGVSQAQATSDLMPIARALDDARPASGRGRRTVVLFELWNAPGGSAEILFPLIALLGAVVGLVLILTCANVSNLLLTRAAGRQHEMAVRLALGAGRWRLMRQLGAESLLLASAGGACGLAIAHATSGLLLAFIPPIGLPIGLTLGLDWRSLAFAGGVTVMTALLVGLVPGLSAARSTVASVLNAESLWSSSGRRRTAVRHVLVVAQVALSLVLLVGAALFLRSLLHADSLKPGFDPQGVAIAEVDLGPSGYDNTKGTALLARLLERLNTTPGVVSATFASRVPLSSFNRSSAIVRVDGYTPRQGERLDVSIDAVGPDYFRTLRIPVRAGREFSADDRIGRPQVAVVNEAMARRFWPAGDAIGRTVRRGRRTLTVIGIAGNVRSYSPSDPTRPGLYVPVLQEYWTSLRLMVRSSGELTAVAPAVRAVVREVESSLPVTGLQAMTEHVRLAFFVQRVGSAVLGVVGVVALLLAALGLYGVVSYSVWRRAREFGVRMALGASGGAVRRLVLGQGLWVFAVGAPLGLAGAVGLALAARSQIYGVSFLDPVSFAAALLLLAIIIVAAAGVPAWRAGRLDIVRVLREQ